MDIINSDHSLLRTQKSGRYKLEKKRKQVQRAESEKIKDVVWSQIEAEKEPFKFWKKFFLAIQMYSFEFISERI